MRSGAASGGGGEVGGEHRDGRAETEEERAEKVGDTLAAIGQLEEAFGTCSNGKAFFAGDSVGYLDLVVGSQLLWFEVLRKMFGVVVVELGRDPL